MARFRFPTIRWRDQGCYWRLAIFLLIVFGGIPLLSHILMPPGSQVLIPQLKSKIGHSGATARDLWTDWRKSGGASQDLNGFAEFVNAQAIKSVFWGRAPENNVVKAEARDNEVFLYFRDGPELPLYDPTNGVLSTGAIAFVFSRPMERGPVYLSGPLVDSLVQVERAAESAGAASVPDVGE
jgi:hypothetical protein